MLKVSGPAEKYVIALLHLMLYVFNSLKTALCESVCDSLQKKKKRKKNVICTVTWRFPGSVTPTEPVLYL